MKKVYTDHCIRNAADDEFDDCEECRCLFCTDTLLIDERYQIESPLGQGAFSEVYKAWDEQAQEYVAVKRCLKDVLHSRAFLKAEAATLATLSHPMLPEVKAFLDETYLVEELFEGSPLSELLKQRVQLPEKEVRTLLQELLDVLEYLHTQGVIHRDIRPENILVNSQGRFLALIDLGLAQRQGVRSPGRNILHEAYAAPERYLRQRAVSSSDLFSAAILAQVCLVGDDQFRRVKQPWQWHLNGNIVSREFVELLEKMTSERLKERPSINEVKRWIRALPEIEISARIAPRRRSIKGYGVSLNPIRPLAAVTTFEGDIEILDVNSGEVLHRIRIEEEILVSRYSSDGALLIAGGVEGGLYIWNEKMEMIHEGKAHGDSILHLASAKATGLLVTGSRDELRVWSVSEGVSNIHLVSLNIEVGCIAFSDDGRAIAIGDMSGNLYRIRLEGKMKLQLIATHASPVTAIAFVPGSHRIVTGHSNGTLELSDGRSHKPLASMNELEMQESAVRGMVFGEQGELFECRDDSLIRSWDINKCDLVSVSHHLGQPVAIDFVKGVIATVGYGCVQLLG